MQGVLRGEAAPQFGLRAERESALEQAQQLLDEGRSVPEVAVALNVLTNTLHKAICAGRLRGSQKKAIAAPAQ